MSLHESDAEHDMESRLKKPKNGMILQTMWLDTMFQNAVEVVTIATVQRGIDNYQTLMRLPDKPAWRDLTDTMVGGELNLDLPLDELEIASDEEGFERYAPENGLYQRVLQRSKRLRVSVSNLNCNWKPPVTCTRTQMTALRLD
ncbi:unnamed protein product [Phytophthora fragariaefolia]|uniref:Unnamed protein product n=1 Tax=Phytophthora fragariaefolia TaxID=1490495 RepID=A0A9W7D7T5_9STRA|nr:unnamed protein product [Phytophthora fragariaefolia]